MKLQASNRLKITAAPLSKQSLAVFLETLGIPGSLASSFKVKNHNGANVYQNRTLTGVQWAQIHKAMVSKFGRPKNEGVVGLNTWFPWKGDTTRWVSMYSQPDGGTLTIGDSNVRTAPKGFHHVPAHVVEIFKKNKFKFSAGGGYVSADNGTVEVQFHKTSDPQTAEVYVLVSPYLDPSSQEELDSRELQYDGKTILKFVSSVVADNLELLEHLGNE